MLRGRLKRQEDIGESENVNTRKALLKMEMVPVLRALGAQKGNGAGNAGCKSHAQKLNGAGIGAISDLLKKEMVPVLLAVRALLKKEMMPVLRAVRALIKNATFGCY